MTSAPLKPVAVAPALTLRDVGVAYHGVRAVSGVSLDVRPAAITGIIGPSGCGKSSVIQCLNRLTDLLPGCTVTGRIHLGDQDLLDPALDVLAHRRRVGMIFQRPNPFPLSIGRNLELPLREHGVRDRAAREARIERALTDVGLWTEVRDRLNAPAARLSGGQQQRLCLARALVLEPEVLLLDEPCSALDPIASGVVEDLIVGLRESIPIVMVTHDLAQARRVADDVAVFWLDASGGGGRLIECGPVARVFTEPADPITAAYLAGRRT